MKRNLTTAFAVLALLATVAMVAPGGQASGLATDLPTVFTTVQVGTGDSSGGPTGVGVDTGTNRIFVANNRDNAIYVVDGGSNTVISTLTSGLISSPSGVAANSSTGKVYVANSGRRSVLVINASTLAISEIGGLGPGPTGIAIDESANLIYVTNFVDYEIGQSMSIINGATDTLSTTIGLVDNDSQIPSQYPYGIALDTAQHRAYVSSRWGTAPNYVTAVDTWSLEVRTYWDYPMTEPAGIAVRPASSAVFVAQRYNSYSNPSLAIFDYTGGVYHKLLSLWTGLPLLWNGNYQGKPIGVAYNPTTDRIFVNSYNQNSVVVVDALNLTVLTALGVGTNPEIGVAVNPSTSMVYVANRGSGTLTVIRDGAAGPTPTPTNTPTPTITPTPTPAPCTADAYEPDNSSGQAAVIAPTFGFTQSHSFCGTSSPWYLDEDWVTFAANGTPREYTMTTSNLTEGADTVLSLYGPNAVGTKLAGNDDYNFPTSLASQIVYSITEPGLYYLHITNAGPVATAAKLRAQGITQVLSAIPQRNYDLSIIGGPPLSNVVFLPLALRD